MRILFRIRAVLEITEERKDFVFLSFFFLRKDFQQASLGELVIYLKHAKQNN